MIDFLKDSKSIFITFATIKKFRNE